MSTITDHGPHGKPAGPIGFFATAAIALAGWFSFIALMTLVAPPTGRVLVLAPSQDRALEAILGAGGRIVVGLNKGVIADGAGRPGFALDLYRAGAWLVLPATSGACSGRRVLVLSQS